MRRTKKDLRNKLSTENGASEQSLNRIRTYADANMATTSKFAVKQYVYQYSFAAIVVIFGSLILFNEVKVNASLDFDQNMMLELNELSDAYNSLREVNESLYKEELSSASLVDINYTIELILED